MEINNFSQSSSLIYEQIAKQKTELSNLDKTDLNKSTQDSYDKVNVSDNNYNQKDQSLNSLNELNSAEAEITKTANLNKLLLESQINEENQGVSYAN